ncbi:transposase [Bacillus toyonensis]|uniref:Transposase n=1 Tax=Bacillus toyonensis TaxID=155322 RepID=A0A2C3MIC9_9BACI|nr:transposase [Bacillus toyonensis]PEE20699.1 transposase [Bacillus toyonensis]PEJ91309.1 transposase [Bacillus toyonensis]PEK82973.1 transposase [Bacillus toyonensis]PEL22870.1 transposase [Bacillus toyonensis]PEO52042.1 transposase [Bacillus toyonensis]
MVRHCVDRVFVKDLKCEIGSPESHELSIHKTNFENWGLELSANKEELHYFEEEKQKKGPIEFAIYIQYMNRLTGKAIVKSIEKITVVVKGITVLYGYRYVSQR